MDNPGETGPSNGAAKPRRVLACQLCQQRKVKCDRKFPCSQCSRMKAQCIPAALVPRQRRRRFPERELLERIREYERLLHQHHVPFRPLHPDATVDVITERPPSSSDERTPEPFRSDDSAPPGQEKRAKPKTANLWHALRKTHVDTGDDSDTGSESDEPGGGFIYDDDEDMGTVIKTALDSASWSCMESNSAFLFGSPASTTSLTGVHPDQATIFRLWQIYLDNVNPLLKVTHTPSLQPRIIDAMDDLANISAHLEALLFSIYCTSIMSLSEDQCRTLFGSSRRNLLTGYQFACRQALSNANLLQTCDHDCLVALFLYLVSIKSDTDPRSVSSLLAVAIHIARRMNYDKESSNEKYPILEAEMRRRLWWSLVILDSRVCETFNYRSVTMTPTWNCKTPSNLNDFELLSGSRTAPQVHDKPTEALFVRIRSQINDFIRHCPFHLESTDPFLATLVGSRTSHYNLRELQETIEKTFTLCDPAHPLHYMTMWTTRGMLAKNMLFEHCFGRRREKLQQQQQQRHQPRRLGPDPPGSLNSDEPDPAIGYAITMLRCDTALLASPLTRGFIWYTHAYFPFIAYIYLAQYLPSLAATTTTTTTTTAAAAARAHKSRAKAKNGGNNRNDDNNDDDPVSAAWEAMSDNYEARLAADFFVSPSGEKDQSMGDRERIDDGGRRGAPPSPGGNGHPLFVLFARVVLRAWDAVVAARATAGCSRDVAEAVPRIVVSLRERLGNDGTSIGEGERGTGSPRDSGGDGHGSNSANRLCDNADAVAVNAVTDFAGGYGFGGAYMDVLLGDGGTVLVDAEGQQPWPVMDWTSLTQHGF